MANFVQEQRRKLAEKRRRQIEEATGEAPPKKAPRVEVPKALPKKAPQIMGPPKPTPLERSRREAAARIKAEQQKTAAARAVAEEKAKQKKKKKKFKILRTKGGFIRVPVK